jgi:hypothetical protein
LIIFFSSYKILYNYILRCLLKKTYRESIFIMGEQKNRENWLNWENWKKNNWKNRTVKKKTIKPIKILKNRPVRFYKPETEKTEPNPNWKKSEKTEPNRKNRAKIKKTSQNRAKLVFVKKTEPNRTETGQFEPVSFFF